jgi:hypothetical protein
MTDSYLQEQIKLLFLLRISKTYEFFVQIFADKCFKLCSCFGYYLPLSGTLFRDQIMHLLSSDVLPSAVAVLSTAVRLDGT